MLCNILFSFVVYTLCLKKASVYSMWYICLESYSISNAYLFTARKQEIIKATEQLIDCINSGDFEGYT